MKWALISVVILSSCTAGVSLKSVDYSTLLNDDNSKLWLVNKFFIDGRLVSPTEDLKKDVIMFYSNENFNYIGIRDIARKAPRKGRYSLDSELKVLTFHFNNNEEWGMKMAYLTEDSLLLVPAENAQVPYSFQLIPFPEL